MCVYNTHVTYNLYAINNIYVIVYATAMTNETISLDTRHVVTRLLATVTDVHTLLEI